MRKLLLTAALALLVLAAVVSFRTVTRAVPLAPVAPAAALGLDPQALAQRLAEVVRIPTISRYAPTPEDEKPFADQLVAWQKLFPEVFQAVKLEVVSDFSLLLEWPGSDPTLKPLLLLAHQDVVPIAPGTEKDWQHPPFAGVVDGGFIWGRGTLDDKSSVAGILEAVRALLASGARPKRTVLMAFGHDEEIGGKRGAQVIAARLKERGVEAELVLDEGGIVADGMLDGVTKPVAMIGISEKGYLSVELAVTTAPGHSSTPPRATAIGRLARAIVAVEDHPFAPRLDGGILGTLTTLVGEMDLARRAIITNLWLFKPLLLRLLGGSDTGRASTRTTIAPTIFNAGDKDNVLPGNAKATINFRLLPGDSIASVMQHLANVIDDPEVKLTIFSAIEASPVSDPAAPQLAKVAAAARAAMPGILAAPFLTIGGTDATHYTKISPNVYRFHFARFTPDDLKRFHGTNERISVDNYVEGVSFYAELIRSVAL